MNLYSKKNAGLAILLALLMIFSGCSSKSSSETSSGGGSADSSPATGGTDTRAGSAPGSSLAGTYTGSATATASALGLTESETVPVTITIDQNGTVTIQSGSDLFPNVITLNGNTFGYSQTFDNESFGSATCSGTLTLQGSVNNGVLTATLSSQNVSCNNIPGTVSGTMTATRQ